MAKLGQVEYINRYVSGNTALQPQPMPQKKVVLPKPRKKKVYLLRIYPAAAACALVALVLFTCLVSGFLQLQDSLAAREEMEIYVQKLQAENAAMEQRFKDSYDMDEVEDIAGAIGLVPMDRLERIPIDVTVPEEPREPNVWEAFVRFVQELFA